MVMKPADLKPDEEIRYRLQISDMDKVKEINFTCESVELNKDTDSTIRKMVCKLSHADGLRDYGSRRAFMEWHTVHFKDEEKEEEMEDADEGDEDVLLLSDSEFEDTEDFENQSQAHDQDDQDVPEIQSQALDQKDLRDDEIKQSQLEEELMDLLQKYKANALELEQLLQMELANEENAYSEQEEDFQLLLKGG